MDTPNLATLKHLADRLKANDIAWFKDRFKAGDLAWLTDRLPEGGYTKLGDNIEAGDLAYVRTIFGGLDIEALSGLSGAKVAAGGPTKSPNGVVINDARRKNGAVWLLPVGLLLALLLGFGLSRLGKDDKPDGVKTDTTAAADASIAPPTTTIEVAK